MQQAYENEMDNFWTKEKEADYMFDIGILDEVDGRLQEESNHLFSVQEDVFHQEMADERTRENHIYNTVTIS